MSDYKMIDNVLMKQRRYVCVKAHTTAAEDECSICLRKVKSNSDKAQGKYCKQLICDHVFHVDCINKWLHRHTRCPLCRKNLYVPCSYLEASSTPYTLISAAPHHYNIYKS